MSVAITTEIDGIDRLNARLDRLARPALPKLLHQLVAEGGSQTRRRIEQEGPAPDGTPWAEWSANYAAGRHENHKKLQDARHLYDSITGYVDGEDAGWGSNLVYAAIHQFGFDGPVQVAGHSRKMHMPARPFLGISPENEEALLAIVDAYVDRLLSD